MQNRKQHQSYQAMNQPHQIWPNQRDSSSNPSDAESKATSELLSNGSTPSNLAQSEGPSPTCRPTAFQLICGCLGPHQCGVVDSSCHDLNRHGACTCSVDSTLEQGSQKQYPPLMHMAGMIHTQVKCIGGSGSQLAGACRLMHSLSIRTLYSSQTITIQSQQPPCLYYETAR